MPCVNCNKTNSEPMDITEVDHQPFYDTLGVDPTEWKIGFQYVYRNNQFYYFLLLKNLRDPELNTKVLLERH
jgi:hypothetical protein